MANTVKFVKYNGGKQSFYPCTNPQHLVKGKIYEVTHEEDIGCQIEYWLDGIDGHYNSKWFNEIPAYIGISLESPKLLKEVDCLRVDTKDKNISIEMVKTSYARKIVKNDETYTVITNDGVYFIVTPDSSKLPTYLAVGEKKPELKKPLLGFRVDAQNHQIGTQEIVTTPIRTIKKIVHNTYAVYTVNSCYIFQLFK